MDGKEKVTKLTKVILNDMKGKREIYQDEKGKIKKKYSYRIKRENETWKIAWKTLLVIFIIDFSIFSYFKFYKHVGVIEGLDGWSRSVRSLINRGDQQKTTRQENYYDINKSKPSKNDRVYKWTDSNGKVYYSNVPIGADRKNVQIANLPNIQKLQQQKTKQYKLLKYIVYIKNGGQVECSSISRNENMIVLMTKDGLLMNIDENKIDKIEQYQFVNNNIRMTKWKP